MLQARSGIEDLEGLRIILGRKLPRKMWGTLKLGFLLVAIANDLDDLILILRERLGSGIKR